MGETDRERFTFNADSLDIKIIGCDGGWRRSGVGRFSRFHRGISFTVLSTDILKSYLFISNPDVRFYDDDDRWWR